MMIHSRYIVLFLSLIIGVLFLGGLLSGASSAVQADPLDLFVTTDGDGDCSQADPCDLQTALDVSGDGDSVYLAEGVYCGDGGAVVTLTHGVSLFGGWDGSVTYPVVSDPSAHPTILDAEEERRGIFLTSGIQVTLEGFTVTNGIVNGDGAGLYARNANLVMRDMAFFNNFATAEEFAYGGGAFVEGGSLVVQDSDFIANSADSSKVPGGAGIAISSTVSAEVISTRFVDNDSWTASGLYLMGDHYNTPLILSDCTFEDNGRRHDPFSTAMGGYGAACVVVNSIATIERNTFYHNKASNDYGALAVFYSELNLDGNILQNNECAKTSALYLHRVFPFTATNNIIADNRSTFNSVAIPAINVRYSEGKIVQNTIARNQSEVGLLLDGESNIIMTNTILVSHTLGISVTDGSTGIVEATLWGDDLWANRADWGGPGKLFNGTINIRMDPLFVDPANGDFHISEESPAVDVGLPVAVVSDVDRQPRPFGKGYDLGADEFAIWTIHLPSVVQ